MTEPSDSSGPSPLEDAMQALRSGDTPQARRILGIPADRMSDEKLLDCLVALDQALDLLREQRHPEANERLQRAKPLADASDNEDLRGILTTYTHLTEGITRLLHGDAAGALEHLEALADEFERMAFFAPRMAKTASATRAWAFIALSRAAMNAGDLAGAEEHFRTVRTEQDRLLGMLDEKLPEDLPAIVEVHATRVEIAAAMAMVDLQVLDLDAVDARLQGVQPETSTLPPLIARLPETPLRSMASAVLGILQAMTGITAIERDLLLERHPTTQERLARFQDVARHLMAAADLAARAGQRGAGYLSMLRQLDRLRAGLLNADRVRREDFGRFSGLVSVIALVVLLAAIRFTVSPSGAAAAFYLLGALIVALVAGFGYGALRFQPLLRLYAQVASGGEQPNAHDDANKEADPHA